MDTAREALFKAMLTDGWFTASDGDVEAPTGYFGYVINQQNELAEVREAFSEVIDAYGEVSDEDLVGAYVALINSQGFISIIEESQQDAREHFLALQSEYESWIGDDEV